MPPLIQNTPTFGTSDSGRDKSLPYRENTPRGLRQLCNLQKSFFLPLPGIFQQVPCVAGWMPGVGYQKVRVVHGIMIRPDNSQPPGNALHARRIKGGIEPRWNSNGPFCRVIGKQKGQNDFRVLLLCPDNCPGCKKVKSAIVSNKKFRYTMFRNMGFDGFLQGGQNGLCRLPMPNKEAAFSSHRYTPS